jgi:hypothetical protein
MLLVLAGKQAERPECRQADRQGCRPHQQLCTSEQGGCGVCSLDVKFLLLVGEVHVICPNEDHGNLGVVYLFRGGGSQIGYGIQRFAPDLLVSILGNAHAMCCLVAAVWAMSAPAPWLFVCLIRVQ